MSKDYETSYRQFSVFREESSHGALQPGRAEIPARFKGKQFGVRPLVHGRMPDVYLDKQVRSLGDGDQYLDAIYLERELKQMVGGKNITQKAFFPPKCTKHRGSHVSRQMIPFVLAKQRVLGAMPCSACPGAIEPCLGPMGLLAQDWQERPRQSDSIKGKKKIYTSPTKKGGFGYPLSDRTLGTPQAYMPDEYQRGRLLGKELRKQARQRIPKAFNSMPSTGQGLFNPNPYKDPGGPTYRETKAKRHEVARPWKPTCPPRKAAHEQTLSKVGRDYMPDPVREPVFAARDAVKPPPFKPCAGIKERLSMKVVNPYVCDPRPPPSLDFTLFG